MESLALLIAGLSYRVDFLQVLILHRLTLLA